MKYHHLLGGFFCVSHHPHILAQGLDQAPKARSHNTMVPFLPSKDHIHDMRSLLSQDDPNRFFLKVIFDANPIKLGTEVLQ